MGFLAQFYKVLTKDYDRMDTWSIRKNEPKRTQIQKGQNERKYFLSKDYEQLTMNNELMKTNPKQTQFQRANFKSMNNQSLTELFADSLLNSQTFKIMAVYS